MEASAVMIKTGKLAARLSPPDYFAEVLKIRPPCLVGGSQMHRVDRRSLEAMLRAGIRKVV